MRLYGKNPVIERLRSNPRTIKKVYIQEDFKDAPYIRKKANQWGLPVVVIPRSKMIKIARNINTQGILVDVDDFGYVPFDDLLDTALDKNHSLFFLDGLNDPQNLGAIMRSTACLGRFALVLPTHDSVSITEAVLRVASGGDNHVSVSKVSNLANAIKKAKEAGFWIAGAMVGDGEPLHEVKLQFPLGMVVGSEEKGIRDVLRPHLDLRVTIPMTPDRLSFNVAQAATILAYEITRQKNQKGR